MSTDRASLKAEYAIGLLQEALEQLRPLAEATEEGDTAAKLVKLALEALQGSP